MSSVLERISEAVKVLVGRKPKYSVRSEPEWVSATITPSDEASSEYRGSNRPANELIQRCTGLVWTLCNRNASACSQASLRLYRAKTSGRSKYRGRVVRSSRQLEHLRAPYMGKASNHALDTSDIEEVLDHPVIDLLNRPNGIADSGTMFAYQRFFDREWSGTALVHVVGDREPKMLLRLAPQITRIILDRTYFIGGYAYGQDSSVEVRFERDEVMYSRLCPSPFREWLGYTWVQAVILDADRFSAIGIADYTMWTRGGRPDYAIKLPAGTTDQQIRLHREYVAARHQGPQNTGQPYVGLAEEIQVLGWSPRDLEGIASRNDARLLMCNAAGVPESELSINDSNYANSKTGARRYLEATVRPRLTLDADFLTNQLLPRYGIAPGEMWFAYDNVVPEDQEAMTRQQVQLLAAGALCVNEIRQQRGLDEVEGGDRFYWQPMPAVEGGNPDDPNATPIDQNAANALANAGRDVRAEALNGAQVQSLTTIVQAAANGQIPTESAQAIATAAFPLVPSETIAAIFSPLDGFTPAPAPGTDPASQQSSETPESSDPAEDTPEDETEDADEPTETGEGEASKKPEAEDTEPEEQQTKKPVKSMHPAYCAECQHDHGHRVKGPELRGFADLFGVLSRWFQEMEPRVVEQAKSGNPDDVSADPDSLAAAVRDPLQSTIMGSARQAFAQAPTNRPIDAFNVVSANVVKFLETYSPKLATAVAEETTIKLRDAMREGLIGGETIPQLQRRVADALGEEAGYRSEKIARTEAAFADTKGNIEGWKAADISKKKWVRAPGSCPICNAIADNNPDPIPMEQPFYAMGETIPGTGFVVSWEPIIGAPAHPFCRCILIPVV